MPRRRKRATLQSLAPAWERLSEGRTLWALAGAPTLALFQAGVLPRLAPRPGEGRGTHLSRCLDALLPPGELEELNVWTDSHGTLTLGLVAHTPRRVAVAGLYARLEAHAPGLGGAVLAYVEAALRFPLWDALAIWNAAEAMHFDHDLDDPDLEIAPLRITPALLEAEVGTPWQRSLLPGLAGGGGPLGHFLTRLEALLALLHIEQGFPASTDLASPPLWILDYGPLSQELFDEWEAGYAGDCEYEHTHLTLGEPGDLTLLVQALWREYSVLDALAEHLEAPMTREHPALPSLKPPPQIEALHEVTLEELERFWTPPVVTDRRCANASVRSAIDALRQDTSGSLPSFEALLF